MVDFGDHPNDHSSLWVGYPWQVAPLQSLRPFGQPGVLSSSHPVLSTVFWSRCVPLDFTGFSGGGQFGFTLRQDGFGSAFEFIFRGNVADGTMQAAVSGDVHPAREDQGHRRM